MNPFNLITSLAQNFKDKAVGWFAPGTPINTSAPPETEVRQIEYSPGYNYNITPRAQEPISFQMLRNLADNCDLLRVIIETRKDQLEILNFDIVPIDKADKSQEANREKVKKFLRKPDNRNRWKRWLRALLEDVFVIDAPTIEPRRTRGKEVYSLELVDGATISVKSGIDGRTPIAPEIAYQQILYGMPAVNLTTDDLIYFPRNKRTHKFYGCSPVEQIIMTVNIAIRRQGYLLGFFTDGNIPDTAFSCPPDWKAPQIAEFQAYWDSMFEGNQNMKRKGRFIPDGVKPFQLKNPELKGEIDEWLARIICFHFSTPPTPFCKETNRATAETVAEASKAEGLAPLKSYVKELMDTIIQDYMKYEDLEFVWVDEESANPLEKAQIDEIYIRNKVIAPSEVRTDLGKEPMTDEQKEEVKPQADPMLLYGGFDEDGEPVKSKAKSKEEQEKGEGLEKVEKVAKKKSISRSREPRHY